MSKSGYSLIGSTSYGIEALRLSGFAAGVSAPVRGLKVVCDGNSLTAGTGVLLANQYYPSQMASSLRYGSSIVNLGVPSATTSQRMAANGTGPVFSANAIAILWEITNELKDGVSAETAYTNFVSWAQAVRAQGYRVLVGTVIPRSEAGLVGSFETSRQAINTNIRNNWNTFADGICDFGADPSIGAAGASASTTYFNADQVHLNAAGYAVAANIAKTAVLAL